MKEGVTEEKDAAKIACWMSKTGMVQNTRSKEPKLYKASITRRAATYFLLSTLALVLKTIAFKLPSCCMTCGMMNKHRLQTITTA